MARVGFQSIKEFLTGVLASKWSGLTACGSPDIVISESVS